MESVKHLENWFHKYLRGTYCTLSLFLGTADRAVNKTHKCLSTWSFLVETKWAQWVIECVPRQRDTQPVQKNKAERGDRVVQWCVVWVITERLAEVEFDQRPEGLRRGAGGVASESAQGWWRMVSRPWGFSAGEGRRGAGCVMGDTWGVSWGWTQASFVPVRGWIWLGRQVGAIADYWVVLMSLPRPLYWVSGVLKLGVR